jgi:hypothetical protein
MHVSARAGGGAERVALFNARTLVAEELRVNLVVARSRGGLRDEPLPKARKLELVSSPLPTPRLQRRRLSPSYMQWMWASRQDMRNGRNRWGALSLTWSPPVA